MGIFDNFLPVSRKEYTNIINELNALKSSRKEWEQWQLATAEGEALTMPDPSIYDHQAELYRKLSWVLLAVDIAASAAALTKFSVARLIAGKEPKDIPNHDFEILLQRPNELDSRFEFLYATVAFWKLNGNSYWWLNNSEGEEKPPSEMWVIPPSMIIPVPDKNLYLRGYMYYPGNGMEIFLQPNEIVHFKRFNPFSRFVGLSAIEAIALVAAGDLGMQKYNTTLFANNNGRLPSVMTFEQMVADPTWEKIKHDTREASRNREMLMLRGVGQGGVQWLQNAVSQREMEFLEGRKANKEEIMTTVAPGSFTMLSENSTQANSVVGRATFYDHIYGMQVMMAEKITASILSRYDGRKIIGHFEDVRVTDKELKLKEQEAFERTHTLGEVREEIYGDDLLGDERDDLLMAEIGKSTPKPDAPAPVVNNVKPDEVMPKQPETQPNMDEAQKATRADLERYQRKALRSVGKAVKFDSENIPAHVLRQIEGLLPACKSEDEVKSVFRNQMQNSGVNKLNDTYAIIALAEAINKAVQ